MSKEGSVAPKERVNIVYKPATGNAQEEVELPLRILMAGDYTQKADSSTRRCGFSWSSASRSPSGSPMRKGPAGTRTISAPSPGSSRASSFMAVAERGVVRARVPDRIAANRRGGTEKRNGRRENWAPRLPTAAGAFTPWRGEGPAPSSRERQCELPHQHRRHRPAHRHGPQLGCHHRDRIRLRPPKRSPRSAMTRAGRAPTSTSV